MLAAFVAHEQIIDLKGQVTNLTTKLGELSEDIAKSSQRASVAESQWDEALVQLSSLEETHHQRDEAWAQRNGALACAIVL